MQVVTRHIWKINNFDISEFIIQSHIIQNVLPSNQRLLYI